MYSKRKNSGVILLKKIIFAGVLAVILLVSAVTVSVNDTAQPTQEQDIVKPTGDPGGMG